MPRPNLEVIADVMERPSLEDELRATANWIDTRAMQSVEGVPNAMLIDIGFAKRIAGWLRAYADEKERAA